MLEGFVTFPNRRPRRRTGAVSPSLSLAVLAGLPVVAAAFVPSSVRAANGLASIRLTAHPTVLRADGRSMTVITAQVYDERGNFVADGAARVRFSTTAGRLDSSVVTTQGGVARVTLTAADQPGEAQVVAVLDTPGQAVPANLTITFTADADASQTGTAWAHIEGANVGYVMDAATVQASGKEGGARFTFRGVTLTADTLQINTKENTVRAVGNVTLAAGREKGGVTRTYRNLVWQLVAGTGLGERIEPDGLPKVYAVRAVGGVRLEEAAPGPEVGPIERETWELADLSGGNVIVVARSIDLEPDRRMQFRRVTLWWNGTKTLSAPFHVIDLTQGTLFQDQIVGYGPNGVSFDLPFYYDVRPAAVGTLHMRRGAAVGSSAYSVRPVWTVDLVQAYNGANSAEGVVEVNGITRGDWGARLRHGQRLDARTTGNVFIDFPNNRDLFLNSQVSRTFRTFHVDLSGSGSRSGGGVVDPVTQVKGQAGGDVRGQLSAETFARTFWGVRPLQYRFNMGVSRQGFYGQNTGVSQGTVTNRTVGMALDSAPLPLNRRTKFRQSFLFGHTWVHTSRKPVETQTATGADVTTTESGGASADGLSLRGTSALDYSLGRLGGTTLTYDYTQAPTLGGIGGYYGGIASAGATARHRVGMSAYLSGGAKWSLNLTGSRGLDFDQSTLLSNLRVSLGGPWAGGASLSQTRISGFTFREIQYSLTRRISGKDYTLSYSTTARRFFFNFGGMPF
jgi:hypothetical protein